MRMVFADANYWVALANPKDQLHTKAVEASRTLGSVHLVTTDEVLCEFLNFFCKKGTTLRKQAVSFVDAINEDANVTVVPQSRESFVKGIQLYQARPDKDYSMADCISMETMRDQGLHEVLTNDHHFAQEQFVVLMPEGSP